jgi:menaquinone-dependent protoporphyrinogen IX oxidase
MRKKVLVVYGTRYGATEGTSEEIAKVLRSEGLDVSVVNARKEKVKDVSGYHLIVVGSGVQMGKWTGAAEKFLQKLQKELSSEKVAIFVSSGAQTPEETENARRQYLEGRASKYGLHPISIAVFGGVWDFNKMFFLFRKPLASLKPKLEEAGFKEVKPGLYDTRDWDAIRAWAKQLAGKV